MRRHHSGITLVEILVTLPIVAVLLYVAGGVGVRVLSKSSGIIDDQGLRAQGNLVLRYLESELRSTARIDPRQDLNAVGDQLYKGLYGYVSSPLNSSCNYQTQALDPSSDQFSILRWTSFSKREQTELLLNAWNETSVCQPPAACLPNLDISYHNDPSHPFQIDINGTVTAPKEVLLLDAEGLASQRYLVGAAHHFTNAPLPNPVLTKVQLGIPPTLSGATPAPVNRWYITGSFVFPVATKHVCTNASGQIIEINDLSGKSSVLLDPAPSKHKLIRFQVSYYSSKNNAPIGGAVFSQFPQDPLLVECVNFAKIQIELTPENPQAKTTSSLLLETTVMLPNLNINRPASCL